ncbi:putative tubulin--tyrosine ligase PBY1 [Meyerozyma sp. JA9]|nr:putative tubulin--tyrosine ligase PBY1 [Meyerozyma sp. JA9]
MHVLLTNDDGPLDNKTCPYIKYLVDEINSATDWHLSIVVPNQQRSWIGKAHFAGRTLSATYIYTKNSTRVENPHINSYDGPYDTPQHRSPEYQEWCLIDSTPAACADIGIHHMYDTPVDLVVSGPNFGKNSSNLYILTSGTVGAAMEAVTHGVKAVALSYAFNSLDHDFAILKEAARISVKLIAKLYRQLQHSPQVDLFSVNIPLVESLQLGKTRIHYAPILQNSWNSIYAPNVDANGRKQFVWNPDFKKVYKDGLLDTSHTDSRVLLNEGISVTPLRAAFTATHPLEGEISLEDEPLDSNWTCLVTLPETSYVYGSILEACKKHSIPFTTDRSILGSEKKVFHYGDYEDLDIDLLQEHPERYFVCSYIYRKSLIRKHFLANTVHHYVAKNPSSVLTKAVPETFQLEVDYAEFLDDALDECYELRQELESGKDTWILKPSMSDKGQGIRLFKTVEQLQAVFDSFEESDDEENEKENDEENGVIVSQLRHFIVQKYISNPLLLDQYDRRKFHLRTYVVSVGNLSVYVYKDILCLFADSPYTQPDASAPEVAMEGHLTNTCIQGTEPLVVPFWEVEYQDKDAIFDQVQQITADLFRAAVNVDRMNFQPLDNAIEIYGLDFLVANDNQVSLLEVNAYPDFKQTGQDLKTIIDTLFEQTLTTLVGPLILQTSPVTSDKLVPVLQPPAMSQ